MNKNQILTPNQVAELMMVSPATVRQWAAKGTLNALTTPGGHRRFRMSDVISFAQKKGMTLNTIDEDKIMSAVLIVDDDKQFAGYLKELIYSISDSIQVEVAHDGFEAGRLIHTFQPDLVLLDLMMPTMDGFDSCKRIKSNTETKNIRIIAMTGFGNEENIKRICKLGAEDCLPKPVDEKIIRDYINTLMI